MQIVDIPAIPAAQWNETARDARRDRPLRGAGILLVETADGITISATPVRGFLHPWQLSPRWVRDDNDALGGHWGTTVRPGFVNGYDVSIEDDDANPLALIEDPAPLLKLTTFRDPTISSGITVSGDQIIILGGEGYPRYFDDLGVIPNEAMRDIETDAPDADPDRTRLIRACDIVLETARPSAKQEVTVGDPIGDQQAVTISTSIDLSAVSDARHTLRSTPKFTGTPEPTDLDRLAGTAVEAAVDQIQIGTIWLISPPKADPASDPDQSWDAYSQHFVFWNLHHASRAQVETGIRAPITLHTGLAAGIGDTLIASLLAPLNDAFEQVRAFLDGSDFTGRYWT